MRTRWKILGCSRSPPSSTTTRRSDYRPCPWNPRLRADPLTFSPAPGEQHGYPVQVMGASFRNVGEIKGLAGCDYLTIGPKWLDAMQSTPATEIPTYLSAETAKVTRKPRRAC